MSNDNKARIERAVYLLRKRRVLVGIPSDAMQTEAGGKSPPPLWLIGYINEFGDDELRIPPRPFLRPGVRSKQDEIKKCLLKAVHAALTGNVEQMDGWLRVAGEAGKAGVLAKLSDGSLPPLAESTIYRRRHRTNPPPNQRTSPLVDQGDLRRSVQAVVVTGR